MNVSYREKALIDQESLSDRQFEEIEKEIQLTAEKGFNRNNIKLVPNNLLERPIWQLTIDEKKTNHRVYLDVRNSTLVVLAIWRFDFTHQGDQHWKELDGRM